MKNVIRPLALLALCASTLPALAADAPAYHLVKKIALPGNEGWDYLTLDSAGRRLYVSHGTHVAVVNVDTGEVAGDIPDVAGVHGIAIDPKSGRGFTSNGRSDSVTIFDTTTLKKVGEAKTGGNPDAIIFDPATERVFAFNGRGQSATVIEGATGAVAGTIPLPGRPEFAAADGKGHVYNNIEDKSEVVAIDAKTLKVDNTWSLAPGDGPSGMAMDIKNRRIFSVCSNGMMTVMDADSGKVVATPAIGKGPDAAAFDPTLNLAFSSNGQDGTLSVYQETTPDQYTLVGTVPTQTGARTMTLDEKTHHVFTVTAQPAPTAAGGGRGRRSYMPGTFTVLEFAP